MKPPNPVLAGQWEDGTEVTLRDLFAAAALASWGEPSWGAAASDEKVAAARAALIADTAYRLADAMLAERARGEGDRG